MNTIVICQKCEKPNRVSLNLHDKIPICGSCKVDLPLVGSVQDLNYSRLKKLVQIADKFVIVDFWASWCGPCKMFAPIYTRVANLKSDRFIFGKLNTEEAQDAAQAYGIRGIPTLIVFRNGAEIRRQSGAMPEAAFNQFLDSL